MRRRFPKPRAGRKASAPAALTLPDGSLTFTLQKDGFRTLRLSVHPDGSIRVRAPESTPLSAVFAFVESRRGWIERTLAFFAAHRPAAPVLADGGTVWFLGRPFTVRAVPAAREVRPRLQGGELLLPCRNEASLSRAFRLWRQSLAKSVLTRRLARLDAKVRAALNDDAPVPTLSVRSLRRRWGSCSLRGNIVLAAQLISLPLPLLDYVLIHELCHLRRMDHSPAFHALLLRLLPDARERRTALRVWGLEHPRF